jgi:hypothetical protein
MSRIINMDFRNSCINIQAVPQVNSLFLFPLLSPNTTVYDEHWWGQIFWVSEEDMAKLASSNNNMASDGYFLCQRHEFLT